MHLFGGVLGCKYRNDANKYQIPEIVNNMKFQKLEIYRNYDIIDGESGHPLTEGIRGAEAMASEWPEGAEAWHVGETEFATRPVEIAE